MKNGYITRVCFILFLSVFFIEIADACVADTVVMAVQKKDSVIADKPKTKLEISIEGLSNAIYAGRNYGINQYGLNPSVTFNHKSGINLSAFSYGMSETPGLIQETDLGISYIWRLTHKFSLTPGYSYIINQSDSARLLDNKLDITAGLDLDFISIGNSFAFIFGKSTALYDEFTVGKYISLLNKGSVNLYLSPTFVWVLGTKQALVTLAHGETAFKTNIGKGISNGKGNGHKGGTPPVTSTTTDTTSRFMPLSYDFILPVTVTYKNFAFSITPHYDIPVNVSPEESTLTANPFYLSGKIAYTIPFAGKRLLPVPGKSDIKPGL